MKKQILGVVGILLMSGCSTVAISSKGSLANVEVKGAEGRSDRTLCVSNEGYWLFNTIPLCSSSMDWNQKKNGIDKWDVSLFHDETAVGRLTDVFYRYAAREGGEVVDVVVDNRTTYPIGIFGIPSLVGNMLSRREVTITGVLKEGK